MTRLRVRTGLAVLVAFVLAACATVPTQPVDPEVAGLTTEFIHSKDDQTAREGLHPTYVALERTPEGKFKVLAVSNRFIPLKRKNQEQVFFTRNFTNAVPAWQSWSMERYSEDLKTGRRSGYIFKSSQTEDRKNSYDPRADSPFLSVVGKQPMPTLSGRSSMLYYLQIHRPSFDRMIAESGALAAAKAYAAGGKAFPSSIPDVQPLGLDAVLLVTPRGGGEVGRYYFVANSALAAHAEPVEAGSQLVYVVRPRSGGVVRVPFDEMMRFKAYRGVEGISSCINALMDYDGQTNREGGFCTNHNFINPWNKPLTAVSPSLGEVAVEVLRGAAYSMNGKKIYTTDRSAAWAAMSSVSVSTLAMDTSRIEELRLLSPAEAAQVRAKLRD